ncbi:MAG: endolytic transglycosylase MltG [Chlorobiaceae bacterium]|jgi:UPF0755 protein|nr:endolytic transglycosylase MltG [Chlorobiaceae bacterium]
MSPRKTPLYKTYTFKIILGALLGVVVFFLFMPGLNTASRQTRLVIHRGTGFREIVDGLYDAGTIKSRWQTLFTGSAIPFLHKIKPGRYDIPPGMSNFQLLYYLHSHIQDEVRITIPEGLELRKVARLLSGKLDFDSTAFMIAASDSFVLSKYDVTSKTAEGYLFPGTYNFVWSENPRRVVEFLIGKFRSFYSDDLKKRAEEAGLNEIQLLTLASIVESETPLDPEKPLVASVYFNRLKKNMRLQADPTIQYALGGTARRLLYKDLKVDSPYNTYRHNGLPPGPICSPGSAAIRAVIRPADTEFLYFVASGKGGHNFSGTLSGHGENIRKYKKTLKATSSK